MKGPPISVACLLRSLFSACCAYPQKRAATLPYFDRDISKGFENLPSLLGFERLVNIFELIRNQTVYLFKPGQALIIRVINLTSNATSGHLKFCTNYGI